MDISLIFGGNATLEDLTELHEKRGFEFVIEDGVITEVICQEVRKIAAEKNFENKIKAFLKEQGAWFIKYWAGSKFTKDGVPDILACINGYFVAIEVKAPNGKPSELQKYHVREINKACGFAVILYPKDWDLFKELVNYLNDNDGYEATTLCNQINERSLYARNKKCL